MSSTRIEPDAHNLQARLAGVKALRWSWLERGSHVCLLPLPSLEYKRECCSQVVGVTSIQVEPDAEDPQARLAGARALRLELEWAAHMSLQACILPLPQLRCNAHLACILNQVWAFLEHTRPPLKHHRRLSHTLSTEVFKM